MYCIYYTICSITVINIILCIITKKKKVYILNLIKEAFEFYSVNLVLKLYVQYNMTININFIKIFLKRLCNNFFAGYLQHWSKHVT